MTERSSRQQFPTGDVELDVLVAGDGPTVVLVHGFPELGYSWRHQIDPLVDAGYQVVVPDMRGYGASSAPSAIEQYDIMRLTGDLVALIQHHGDPATVIGHDWGALLAWPLALFRPDLLSGVAAISVPYAGRGEASLVQLLEAAVGPDGFHYMLYFQEPGMAERELDADPAETMRRILWLASGDLSEFAPSGPGSRQGFLDGEVPDGPPPWLSTDELAVYASAFEASGFTGGLNWYRNLHRNWELMAPWHHARIRVPALFVAGDRDPVLTGLGVVDEEHPLIAAQRDGIDDLTVRIIEGAGHWTQQERPQATTQVLLDFLSRVAPT